MENPKEYQHFTQTKMVLNPKKQYQVKPDMKMAFPKQKLLNNTSFQMAKNK
jgi:hypothetical protein